MQALTETVIRFFDLAEAEGRLLQRKVIQTTGIALLMFVTALLMVGSLTFLLAALYQWLAMYMDIGWVFLLMCILCLFLAGGVAWYAVRLSQKV